jgi:hypothetical protein
MVAGNTGADFTANRGAASPKTLTDETVTGRSSRFFAVTDSVVSPSPRTPDSAISQGATWSSSRVFSTIGPAGGAVLAAGEATGAGFVVAHADTDSSQIEKHRAVLTSRRPMEMGC